MPDFIQFVLVLIVLFVILKSLLGTVEPQAKSLMGNNPGLDASKINDLEIGNQELRGRIRKLEEKSTNGSAGNQEFSDAHEDLRTIVRDLDANVRSLNLDYKFESPACRRCKTYSVGREDGQVSPDKTSKIPAHY